MTSLFRLKVMRLAFVVVALGSLPATVNGEATSSPSTFDRAKDSIRPALGPGPWYWENPRPQGNPLLAVFVLDTDDVWAGGSRTLMHWDGKDWTLTDVQPSYGYSLAVRQIWGNDAENLWLVANSDLFRWCNGVWVPSGLPTSPYHLWGAVWGMNSNDVWTASGGGVYHWDGAWCEWTPETWRGGTPLLWGTATDDVTATDGWDDYFHWDGFAWQRISAPPGFYLGGTGPGEPWFYNTPQHLFMRFRSGVWEGYPNPLPAINYALWSDASTEAWALGHDLDQETSFLHFDGKTWSITDTVSHRLRAIGGIAPEDIWAVGEKGAIVRFNGSYEERRAGTVADLNKVFGLSENDLWAVGSSGTVLRRTPSEWEVVQVPTQRDLFDVHGTAADDLWAVGAAGTSLHFDGKVWSAIPTGIPDNLVSVWASTPSDAWAATPQYPYHPFLHWDGTAWSQSTVGAPPGTVHGFWGFAPDDVWAVGGQCNVIIDDFLCVKTISHFDGASWHAEYIGPAIDNAANRFTAVWGTDPQDVWALVAETAIYHWDGNSWSPVDFPEVYACSGVWGFATNDVFATCGIDVVHWDGSSWSNLPTLSAQYLSAVWGAAPSVWMVGRGGTILRYDATNYR